MRDAINEMLCRKEKTGTTWQDLAQMTMRDCRTAQRQLDESANPTLETLEQYATALGGGIHFVPNDWKISHDSTDELRTRLEAQAEEIGKLKAENATLREKVAEQAEVLGSRLHRIDYLQGMLSEVMRKLLERV